MQMLRVFFQLADIVLQCFYGSLQLALSMSDTIDKRNVFLFPDVVKLSAQPFEGMECRFPAIDDPDPVKGLAFLQKLQDLFKEPCLVLRYRLFPDKRVLVRAGFDLCPVNENSFTGDLTQIKELRCDF